MALPGRVTWLRFVLYITAILSSCCQQGEILLNPDFETPFSGEDWEGNGCDISQSTDAYTGVYSCHVSNV